MIEAPVRVCLAWDAGVAQQPLDAFRQRWVAWGRPFQLVRVVGEALALA